MNRYLSSLFVAAGLASGVAALPAVAATPDPAATSVASEKPAATAKRYCLVETRTGSNIKHKTCQTREAWLREGFDPLARK